MALEHPIIPFFTWLPFALLLFVVLVTGIGAVVVLGIYLIAAVRNGPGQAVQFTRYVIGSAIYDILQLSPRRTIAMAGLAFKESIRRYVFMVFLVFVIVLFFATLFLEGSTAKHYIGFVLLLSKWLVLLVVLILSCFSLPADIKSRTIYTIVTKPVRSWEIVLGRIVGFSAIGTLMLAMMCVVSYVFVRRGLDHQHVLEPEDVSLIAADDSDGLVLRTDVQKGHRHRFSLTNENERAADGDDVERPGAASTGVNWTEQVAGHQHQILLADDGTPTFGPPIGDTLARRPVYGKLSFLDRNGDPAEKGISVGKEWTYRGYIEGNSLATAIWKFDGVSPNSFPEGLPLEMTIRVFRTHKGEIEQGILGTIVVRHPYPERLRPGDVVESAPISFRADEFVGQWLPIPRRLKALAPDGTTKDIDLFNDLVYDGEVELRVRCVESGQYFGMAQADMYMRRNDGSFFGNFCKAFFGIWLKMVLVVTFSVIISTLLNAPVAMLATSVSVVIGFFAQDIQNILTGKTEGGGPLESTFRLFEQQNQIVPLGESVQVNVAKGIDWVVMVLMTGVSYVMPNFRGYADYGGLDTGDFLINGFDIPMTLLTQHFLITFGYVVVVSTFGYLFLKTREIAA
ncbi:MAG: hypothetical protein KDA99_01070 [Planctomycetales bacterium]|nr:hypothetical protein [Planctomycetales bacterium]